MSTLKVNSIEPANAGSEDYFLARAWVNFDGTGTVAIRASGNVSSITDNGTGDFTVNFSTALTDANYACGGFAKRQDDLGNVSILTNRLNDTYSTSAVQVRGYQGSWTAIDFPIIGMSVTR